MSKSRQRAASQKEACFAEYEVTFLMDGVKRKELVRAGSKANSPTLIMRALRRQFGKGHKYAIIRSDYL